MLLTAKQEEVCEDFTPVGEAHAQLPNVVWNAITTDESYVSVYDPLTKQQSRQWVGRGDPPPEKQKSQCSSVKMLAITFFDKAGMVYVHVNNLQQL